MPFGLNVVPSVLQQGASEDRGETARMSAFVGALAVTDLVKTTLGPKVRLQSAHLSGGGGGAALAVERIGTIGRLGLVPVPQATAGAHLSCPVEPVATAGFLCALLCCPGPLVPGWPTWGGPSLTSVVLRDLSPHYFWSPSSASLNVTGDGQDSAKHEW